MTSRVGLAMWRIVVTVLTMPWPWPVRRRLLHLLLGYDLHPTSHIGLSLIVPKHLVMHAHSAIGTFNVCKGLDLVEMGEYSRLGRLNWISGYPSDSTAFFGASRNREPSLLMGDHAGITNRHLIDCTATVKIGRFATVAGWRSQILTHSIDLASSTQRALPISLGDFCFVGTSCVVLGGSSLPAYSVLGAQSLLNRAFAETHWLYAGVPSKPIKRLPGDLGYFVRTDGVVH